MMALGLLVGVAAIFVLLVLDDREKRADGLPVLEREMAEEWLGDVEWRWPS